MKILFILDLYKPHVGGVEILFENLIRGLVEQGNVVKVLTSRYDFHLPIYEKLDNGVEIYRVGHNRYDFMLACFKKGIALAHRADIIHTTTYNSAIPASIISKIVRKKVVLTVHEIFGKLWYRFMGWKGFFFTLFESFLFKFHFDKYICVSHYTKNSLRVYFGLPDSKLVTTYLGIDYSHRDKDRYTQSDILAIKEKHHIEGKYVGLFFGRPGISKGLIYFVQALPEIIKQIPRFITVLIVSESSNNRADDVKAFIHQQHLEDYVVWIPGVKYTELGNYILATDVVVVPSLVEGFGFSAAETCALGQQLVVSNAASLPEVVSGKINFVEPSNSHDITQKIVDFYHGNYTSIPEKKFYWKDTIEKTLSIYKEVLGR